MAEIFGEKRELLTKEDVVIDWIRLKKDVSLYFNPKCDEKEIKLEKSDFKEKIQYIFEIVIDSFKTENNKTELELEEIKKRNKEEAEFDEKLKNNTGR
jgi:hypothetical protein